MGIPKSEKGVVKLIHPGRHVEIYTEPITAGEVMMKNPKHCITRPDVFQYPWIVVRPESVLEPGGVFYVVPYRTISNLIKAKKQGNDSAQPLSRQNSNSRMEFRNHFDRCTQFHQKQDRCLINPFNFKSSAQVNTWPKVSSSRLNLESEVERKVDAREGERFRISKIDRKMKNRDNNKVMEELKSCMRKEGSVRKMQNLKVSFELTKSMNRIEAESPLQCVGCIG